MQQTLHSAASMGAHLSGILWQDSQGYKDDVNFSRRKKEII